MEERSIKFVDGIGKRNWAIGRGSTAAFVVAFVDHNNSTQFKMVRSEACKKSCVIMVEKNSLNWMGKES